MSKVWLAVNFRSEEGARNLTECYEVIGIFDSRRSAIDSAKRLPWSAIMPFNINEPYPDAPTVNDGTEWVRFEAGGKSYDPEVPE